MQHLHCLFLEGTDASFLCLNFLIINRICRNTEISEMDAKTSNLYSVSYSGRYADPCTAVLNISLQEKENKLKWCINTLLREREKNVALLEFSN